MPNPLDLSREHQDFLRACAISVEVTQSRGYRSLRSIHEISKLGFRTEQCSAPALLIPIRDFDGQICTHLVRCDSHTGKNTVEYQLPKGSRPTIDVPPASLPLLANPEAELWITDGPLQADSLTSKGIAAIATFSYRGWRQSRGRTRQPLSVWDAVPLKGRAIAIAFGSESQSTHEGRSELRNLAMFLRSRGAQVKLAVPEPNIHGEHVAIHEVLAAGEDPRKLIADFPVFTSSSSPPRDASPGPIVEGNFMASDEGTFRLAFDNDEPTTLPLANFATRVTQELRVTDGVDETLELELEVVLKGTKYPVNVTTDEFLHMEWPEKHIGIEAIVNSRYNARNELREAIQRLSGSVPKVPVYTHLGWVKHEGEWVFIHAGGAIRADCQNQSTPTKPNRSDSKSNDDKPLASPGPKTPISQQKMCAKPIHVRLPPAFQKYALPSPRKGREMIADIQATLDFLNLGPDRIVLPLLAAVFRAAADLTNVAIFLYGETGQFKSQLTLLLLQFFGPELTLEDLRGWDSTGNALGALAFLAKNVLLPVDDFRLAGTRGEIAHANRQADTLLRAQGNSSAKYRCRPDGTLREGKPPRCLIISTGESLPSGHSLNARFLAIEIANGDIYNPDDAVQLERINHAQSLARGGHYARTMAAFLNYLASDYETHRHSLHERRQDFREVFQEDNLHPRLVDTAADLLAGFELFLDFAVRQGAIDEPQLESLWDRFGNAVKDLLTRQGLHLTLEDPVTCYLDLMASAMHCGRAHLKFLVPDEEETLVAGSPSIWGYREKTISVPVNDDLGNEDSEGEYTQKTVIVPRGEQIGWKAYDEVYVDPEASLAVVNRYCIQLGVPEVCIGRKTLGKRLRERGLLVAHDKDRNTLKRNIEGVRREVFHMRTHELVELHIPEEDFVTVLEEEAREEKNAFAARDAARQRVLAERRERVFQRQQQEFIKLLHLEPVHE